MPGIAALRKQRQENQDFKASLGYAGDPVSKQTNKQTNKYP
jgi:hypothetical protein